MRPGDRVWSHLEDHVGMNVLVLEPGEPVDSKPTWWVMRPDGGRVIRYEDDLEVISL